MRQDCIWLAIAADESRDSWTGPGDIDGRNVLHDLGSSEPINIILLGH